MIRLLDLFSGVGGFSLAARMAGGYETIAFCEIEPFCRAVLAKHWPGVPIYEDITKIDPAELPDADIWTGGFPCQDTSCAGKGAGLHGARSGMFFEIVRILHGVRRRPDWLLLENVPAILSRGLDRVLDELAGAGYACWPVVVGAWAVGAPHKRDRVWIVGRLVNAEGAGIGGQQGRSLLAGQEADALRAADNDGPDRPSADDGRLDDATSPRCSGNPGCEPGGQIRNGTLADSGDNGSGRDASPVDGRGWRNSADRTPDVQDGQERRTDQPDAIAGTASADGLADAAGIRCEQHRAGQHRSPQEQGRVQEPMPRPWPSRPGQPQFDWEAPRLSQFNVGGFLDGLSPGVVSTVARIRRCSDSEAEAWYRRNKVKIDRAMNRLALKAMGNSIVSQCAAIILQWIKNCERTQK